MKENLALYLQLFAEGAEGDTAQFTGDTEAAAAPQATGETEASDAGMQTDRSAEFEKLIKGEFKQAYDARVRDTLQKRLKEQKDATQKLETLTPVIGAMAQRYGVDPEDIPALARAVEADREVVLSQPQARAKHQAVLWQEQAADTFRAYPEFDLRKELQDPRFSGLLKAKVDVKTAYEVLHYREHFSNALANTSRQIEQALAGKLMAAQNRPGENGVGGGSAAVVRQDVSQMSRSDRADIIRRVRKGETIRF